jgi:alpha-beta hydrolase superfamily lysophospholipase
MRKDVEFKTEDGVTLRGWLYLPDEARGRVPTIVMAHGFSAVKENYLDKYAEVYSAAGLGALVFDNRNFGASDGKPRQHILAARWAEDRRASRDAAPACGWLSNCTRARARTITVTSAPPETSPLDLLAGVISTRTAGLGGLDALGVDHPGSWTGLAAGITLSSITR